MLNKSTFAITITSLVVLSYVILSTLTANFAFVFFAMLVSQGFFIWMVISILKDDRSSTRTFDEYFYEDVDIRREY
jgi:hypothetical protein